MVDMIAGDLHVGTAPIAATVLSVPLRNMVFMQRPFMAARACGVSRFPFGWIAAPHHLFNAGMFVLQILFNITAYDRLMVISGRTFAGLNDALHAGCNVLLVLPFVPLHASDKGTFQFFSCFHSVDESGIYKNCGVMASETQERPNFSASHSALLHLAYGSRWHETGSKEAAWRH